MSRARPSRSGNAEKVTDPGVLQIPERVMVGFARDGASDSDL
jgi:hypothetical protein